MGPFLVVPGGGVVPFVRHSVLCCVLCWVLRWVLHGVPSAYARAAVNAAWGSRPEYDQGAGVA